MSAVVAWPSHPMNPSVEHPVSKRPRNQNTRMAPDPSAPNVRDPKQHNDELSKHDTPKREDPTQRDKPTAKDIGE